MAETYNPKSLQELKKIHTSILDVNKVHKESITQLERTALWITKHIGTMGFFFLIFLWTLFWLLWNSFAPVEARFDPFPAFVLWLFISNMIQLMLLPLLMIGQNLQSRHAELRSKAEYEASVKSVHEIEAILVHLENQNKTLEAIARKLERQKHN